MRATGLLPTAFAACAVIASTTSMTSMAPADADVVAPAARTAPTAPAAPTAPTAPRSASQHTRAASYDAQVFSLLNRARAHGRSCGGEHFDAVPPLRRNGRLDHAAAKFAAKMGRKGFFDHTAPDGSTPGDRISATGYRWSSYGENIAAGYATPRDVVTGWLKSPGHCSNIMTAFHDVGVGFAEVPGSPYRTYWVNDFATQR